MNLESHLPLVLDLSLKTSAILLAAFAIARLARRISAAFITLATALAVVAGITGSAFAQVKSGPQKTTAESQVLIDTKFIEVPDEAVDRADFPGNLAVEKADKLLQKLLTKKGVEILSAPRIVTRSGQRAMIEIGNEPSPPAAGLKFEATPKLSAGSKEIELEVTATQTTVDESHQIDGKPVAETHRIKSSVKVTSGNTFLLVGKATKAGRSLLIAVTASVIADHAPAPPDATHHRVGE